MNMDENSMAYVHLAKDDLLGNYQWKGRLDLLNIVMIGISNELPGHGERYELHRLLSTLLSMELSVSEKLGIMEREYSIQVDDRMRKDVECMCNLGQGIFEKGEIKGEIKGEAKMILRMYQKGYTIEQIMDISEKSLEEIKAVIEQKEAALV